MRIGHELFHSGMVRRLVTCFLVVALLPLGATTLVFLGTVHDLLLEQSHDRLALAGDSYAAALHDRLLAIDVRLHELARRTDLDAGPRDGDRDPLKPEFRSLGIVE